MMARPMRVVLVVVIVMISIVVATIGLFLAFWDPCGNQAFEEFRSPAGRWKVIVFERDCGATTGFSTQASLLPLGSPPPNGPGNILSIDGDHGKIPVDDNGKIEVKVTFDGGSTLTLTYPAGTRVFTQVANKDGVLVHHEQVPGKR
jgi:hypothetical protein